MKVIPYKNGERAVYKWRETKGRPLAHRLVLSRLRFPDPVDLWLMHAGNRELSRRRLGMGE
jgi:hypothetical protein